MSVPSFWDEVGGVPRDVLPGMGDSSGTPISRKLSTVYTYILE